MVGGAGRLGGVAGATVPTLAVEVVGLLTGLVRIHAEAAREAETADAAVLERLIPRRASLAVEEATLACQTGAIPRVLAEVEEEVVPVTVPTLPAGVPAPIPHVGALARARLLAAARGPATAGARVAAARVPRAITPPASAVTGAEGAGGPPVVADVLACRIATTVAVAGLGRPRAATAVAGEGADEGVPVDDGAATVTGGPTSSIQSLHYSPILPKSGVNAVEQTVQSRVAVAQPRPLLVPLTPRVAAVSQQGVPVLGPAVQVMVARHEVAGVGPTARLGVRRVAGRHGDVEVGTALATTASGAGRTTEAEVLLDGAMGTPLASLVFHVGRTR